MSTIMPGNVLKQHKNRAGNLKELKCH